MPTVRQTAVPLYQRGFPARLRVLSGLGQDAMDDVMYDSGGDGSGGGYSYDSGSGGDGSGGGYDWSQYTWGGDTSVAAPPSEPPPEMAPPDVGLPPESFAPLSTDLVPYVDPTIAPLVNAGYSQDDAWYIANLVQSGQISGDDWSAFAVGDLTPDDLRQIYGAVPPNLPLVPGRTQAPGGRAAGGGAPSGGGAAGGAPGGGAPKGPSPTVPTQKPKQAGVAAGLKPFTDFLKREDLIKGLPNWMVGGLVVAGFYILDSFGDEGSEVRVGKRRYRVARAD